jgi:cytochrome c5
MVNGCIPDLSELDGGTTMSTKRYLGTAAGALSLAMAALLSLTACSPGEDERAPAEMPQEPTMKGEATTAEEQAPAAATAESAPAETAPAADEPAAESEAASGGAMDEMKTAAGAAMEEMKASAEAAAEQVESSAESAMDSATAYAGRDPQKIYETYCQACHLHGVAGAPKLGDSAAWAPRIEKGMDTLMDHAVNGFNAMPPKGTCGDCSREELQATVEYMISESR